MYPDELEENLKACTKATQMPFAVQLPLLYPDIEQHVQHIINYKVPIVITSAGNPRTWTKKLQSHGIKVIHVVSSVRFALKAEAAGVDAIVAEGFEAGGHNGREETTTFVLTPAVADAVNIPVISAEEYVVRTRYACRDGSWCQWRSNRSRFVLSEESSAHMNFKQAVCNATKGIPN